MARATATLAKKTAKVTATTVDPRKASLKGHVHNLLTMIDGLTSTKTYCVAAQVGTSGFIAIRDFHTGRYNVKFYPNLSAFKMESKGDVYQASNYLSRSEYARFYLDKENLQKFLNDLPTLLPKGSAVAPAQSVFEVLEGKEVTPVALF